MPKAKSGGSHEEGTGNVYRNGDRAARRNATGAISREDLDKISDMDVLDEASTQSIRRYRIYSRKKRSGSVPRDTDRVLRKQSSRRTIVFSNNIVPKSTEEDKYVEHTWVEHKCSNIEHLHCSRCGVLKTEEAPSCRKYKTVKIIRKK